MSELGELRLRDALRGEGRDGGLDQTSELDDVGERMAARYEARERPGQIVGRGLPDERAAACSGLDDAEKLERPQRFADRSAGHLELFGKLSLRGELVAGAKIALLEETLDLLDDALVEAAAADRLDDGQELTSPKKPLVRWSDQM